MSKLLKTCKVYCQRRRAFHINLYIKDASCHRIIFLRHDYRLTNSASLATIVGVLRVVEGPYIGLPKKVGQLPKKIRSLTHQIPRVAAPSPEPLERSVIGNDYPSCCLLYTSRCV